jgi:hypothetical protein
MRASRLKKIKYSLAPFVILPLLLTPITGGLFHIADLAGKDKQYGWLINIHTGNFGIIDLSSFYPFYNALSLLKRSCEVR